MGNKKRVCYISYIYVKYQGKWAVFSISDGEVIKNDSTSSVCDIFYKSRAIKKE